MATLTEGNLQITIDNAVSTRKFDDDSHGLSHCMKAVDFIIELADRYLFVEFKDPQHPRADRRNRDRFIRRFTSGEIDEELKYKYRDSFLYEWASGRANKPVQYLVLIALDTLDDQILLTRKDRLEQILPLLGPHSRSWDRPIATDVNVFNIDSWNRAFPEFPIERIAPTDG